MTPERLAHTPVYSQCAASAVGCYINGYYTLVLHYCRAGWHTKFHVFTPNVLARSAVCTVDLHWCSPQLYWRFCNLSTEVGARSTGSTSALHQCTSQLHWQSCSIGANVPTSTAICTLELHKCKGQCHQLHIDPTLMYHSALATNQPYTDVPASFTGHFITWVSM